MLQTASNLESNGMYASSIKWLCVNFTKSRKK